MLSDTNGWFFYPHGMFYGSYCIQCCMSIPHFVCYPFNPAELTRAAAYFKRMTDKVEQQQQNSNNGQQWGPFPPPFNGRTGEHPFNYEEQHRVGDGPAGDFDQDAARQQANPFMQQLFPRFSIPFPDFTEYQRFNNFQRNAFFPNPFGPQFGNPGYPFHLNPMHNPMTGMDGFNFPHGQHPPAPTNPKSGKESVLSHQNSSQSSEDVQDKPPVLSAEYNMKPNIEQKFESGSEFSMVPKDEPADESMKDPHNKKQEPHPFPFPPPLSAEKPFEQARIREDVLAFNPPPFYQSSLDMGSNNTFKQEMSTPPVIDGHLDYRRLDSEAKRLEFSSGGALHDCQVCLSTHANGLHFGARTCAACAAFFRRTISDDKRYVCKRNQRCTNASRDGTGYRKICRSCRMKRCIDIGMLPENVQHKRNRRDSGSPPMKTPFDTFFNGFYPTFHTPSATTPAIPTSEARTN
uniref:ODR7 n=1 Tax=Caenorhabditis remanei TaxID=31234 RepID=C3U4T5_CAERE|nr:ODR7 [Caenorhabditis remanei]